MLINRTWRDRLSIGMRILFLTIVAFCFFNGRPPARAQQSVSVKDAVQDQRIDVVDARIKDHERSDDERVKLMTQEIQRLSSEIAEWRGFERGVFGGLAGLQILGLFFQFRKGKNKEKEE